MGVMMLLSAALILRIWLWLLIRHGRDGAGFFRLCCIEHLQNKMSNAARTSWSGSPAVVTQ